MPSLDLPWLDETLAFPPLSTAQPDGLLAVGGDLSPQRILTAYRAGIFPWFNDDCPPLWWSPDPRMVVFPETTYPSRSLRKTLRKGAYELRIDNNFAQVIQHCANTPRPGQRGTWLIPEMQSAYQALHELGVAHSFETWVNGKLVGGLYGLAVGQMFYGESMFSHATDASKIAFAHLVRHLREHGFGMIDCQVYTPHLASMGGIKIARAQFIQHVTTLTAGMPNEPETLWQNHLIPSDW